ncbi:glycosyltransferase involved in cell wall biosynthesis [Nesterenkonia sandarakina]|uniref:Glycosyltransferase involved in cell wall biosynthesis n=2 Tax=Nesterenkonia sandarakina TaxID=272918 RepID=A0A2T0YAH8_9MICC|nr:glycosyltransferase involved in cell wall biosynthesis [Nesterenkonia sandarakina]
MRIVFDNLGSTEFSGGMRLHSSEFVSAWLELFAEDSVAIVGGAWVAAEFSGRDVDVVRWPNEHVLGRTIGQLIATPVVGAIRRADFVISLSPIVSPMVPRKRAVAFQHDWRHKINPDEFPAHQRAYRKLWEVSAGHASVNACISSKAEGETRRYVPRAETTVVENGRDHARNWVVPIGSEGATVPTVVTFGHHNNKRPELVIDAFAKAVADLDDFSQAKLVVLGARGDYAEELRVRIAHAGLSGRVELPGFVSDEEYQKIVSGASAVVMASTDEGFGLPIAEAEFFGIPAVVTENSGMDTVFKDYAIVSKPTPGGLSSAIAQALRDGRQNTERTRHTWHDAAVALRAELTERTQSNRWASLGAAGRFAR